MEILKYIILFFIFGTTSFIGILISKKYSNRVKELQEMKSALSMFESKIKFTYEPIPEIGFKGIDVSLIDERGEISAMYNGVPQNKIGIRTDVLENVSKPIGIKMAVRSMAPKVIVADEIGNYNDIEAINYAVCSGVKGIFTAHSLSYETMMLNKELNKLINMKIIERIIFLDSKTKGKIKNVYLLAEDTKNYLREVVKN